jgi:hypothetical protein
MATPLHQVQVVLGHANIQTTRAMLSVEKDLGTAAGGCLGSGFTCPNRRLARCP